MKRTRGAVALSPAGRVAQSGPVPVVDVELLGGRDGQPGHVDGQPLELPGDVIGSIDDDGDRDGRRDRDRLIERDGIACSRSPLPRLGTTTLSRLIWPPPWAGASVAVKRGHRGATAEERPEPLHPRPVVVHEPCNGPVVEPGWVERTVLQPAEEAQGASCRPPVSSRAAIGEEGEGELQLGQGRVATGVQVRQVRPAGHVLSRNFQSPAMVCSGSATSSSRKRTWSCSRGKCSRERSRWRACIPSHRIRVQACSVTRRRASKR